MNKKSSKIPTKYEWEEDGFEITINCAKKKPCKECKSYEQCAVIIRERIDIMKEVYAGDK